MQMMAVIEFSEMGQQFGCERRWADSRGVATCDNSLPQMNIHNNNQCGDDDDDYYCDGDDDYHFDDDHHH